MHKIAVANTVTEMQWILCGCLVVPWVNELKASWKRVHATAECRRCIVNPDEVMFIDKCGERLLRSPSSIGAQYVSSEVYVNYVLDRFRG